MKKTIVILAAAAAALLATGNRASAQARYETVDTVVYHLAAGADSTLYGRDIFSLMPSAAKGDAATVSVSQSPEIAAAMGAHIRSNSNRSIKGYRVRIYFDNKQNSRNASLAAYNNFRANHRSIPAYRIYVNPYFKVTVGDFRTKSEAMQFLTTIKGEYPTAFVVKENIRFPVVDKNNAVVADTLKVVRQIKD